MSIVSSKLKEIEALVSSQSNSTKSVAYSTLLHIQEQSTLDGSTVQELAESTKRLISFIVADSLNEDEEIASKALKCLGFTMYHPSISMTLPVDVAATVLETLSQVIRTTKMKSVCNLGIWCISMQQFEESLLTAHFESLLKVTVHALDNPFGSLSTTFEAIQAVLKLASQLSELMRNSSHIWAPPLYRRLLSRDKRERDMTGRCLSKIKSVLLPPPLLLSKVVASDMKQRLLFQMKEMLSEGLKIQALQAWGWVIRFCGCHAKENRSLVNEMLKVPEMTFTDIDTQVQISTQVAWEALIDAFIQSPTSMINEEKKDTQHFKRLMKSIKLIMTPLTGIVSSKCDASVHSSCLNTWCYLLHKLDICTNHHSVKTLALEPIFDAVFCHRLESSRISMWNLCLHVLDMSVSANLKQNFDCQEKKQTLQYPMKWMPWALDQLDFYLHWVHKIISEVGLAVLTDEDKASLHNAALKVFKSILIGTQMEFSGPSITYDDIFLSLKIFLDFLKRISNEMSGKSVLLIRIVFEELESSIIGSPLYKIPLNLKFIEDLQQFKGFEHVLEISNITYMGVVTPMVYLLVLCVYAFSQSTPDTLNMEEMHRIMKLAVTSFNPLENFASITNLLHIFTSFNSLKIWVAAAESLNDCMDIFITNLGCSILCQFLSYPFSASGSSEETLALRQINRDLGNITSSWLCLYGKISNLHLQNDTAKGFHDQLCKSLNQYSGDISGLLDCSGSGDLVLDLLCLYGNIMMFILEHNLAEQVTSSSVSMFFCNSLRIAAKFMELLKVKNRSDSYRLVALTPRFFSLIGSWFRCLHSKHNILSSIEIMSPALLLWLSDTEPSITDPFHLFWDEIITSLSRSQPPITFDSSFLATQATLLEKALDHPNPSISEQTINFWNTTYGNQPYCITDYPQRLLLVLDRFSRSRRITLLKTVNRYTVTAKHVGISKRVGLLESGNVKRKKCELTEHQKEVKRAQQGKGRDSGGHGAGVRTCTNLNFSQEIEESQEGY